MQQGDRNTTPTFGELLRRLRIAAELTQDELAERAGLSVRGISDLERELVQAPRRSTVDMLADALRLGDDERERLRRAARPCVRVGHASPSAPSNLPPELTSFVGREREIAMLVARLLDPRTRLLTLTGPAGAGKTRLAVQVAARVRDAFADGVCFVALAAATDAARVPHSIVDALAERDRLSRPADTRLVDHLRGKRLLLVLDNLEQVTAADRASAELRFIEHPVESTFYSRWRSRVTDEHPVASSEGHAMTLPDAVAYALETFA